MTDPSAVPIQAVVFDMGGVLLDWDPRHLYRTIFTDEEAMERFLAELDLVAWNVANHDSGARPLDESVADLIAQHPDYATELAAWSERYTEMVSGPDRRVHRDPGRAARPGGAVPAVQRAPRAHRPAAGRLAVLLLVRRPGDLGSRGAVKPDPRLFRVLLDRYDLAPDATVFIDDVAANVAARPRRACTRSTSRPRPRCVPSSHISACSAASRAVISPAGPGVPWP